MNMCKISLTSSCFVVVVDSHSHLLISSSSAVSPLTLKCNAQQQYNAHAYALPFWSLLLSFASAQIAIKPNKVVVKYLNNISYVRCAHGKMYWLQFTKLFVLLLAQSSFTSQEKIRISKLSQKDFTITFRLTVNCKVIKNFMDFQQHE